MITMLPRSIFLMDLLLAGMHEDGTCFHYFKSVSDVLLVFRNMLADVRHAIPTTIQYCMQSAVESVTATTTSPMLQGSDHSYPLPRGRTHQI